MAISNRRLLDALSLTPFVDSTELAVILGEPHAKVHRALTGLLTEGIVGRVSHGTTHLPASSTLVMRWDLIAEYRASLAATTAGRRARFACVRSPAPQGMRMGLV